ncbi:MAG: AEC family transporter [Spirochaetaceae bacterium]|nr:AEC family transporter [Spirochaetaceae bacterium]
MKSLLFALESVLPIILLVVIGYFLGKKKFVDPGFSPSVTKLTFNCFLPAMLFQSIYTADFSVVFSPDLILVTLVSSLVCIILFLFLSRFVTRDVHARASMVHGSFRGNSVIIALPIIANLFGPEGKSEAAILLAFLLPFSNVCTVLILSWGNGNLTKAKPLQIIKSIFTNPITIAVLVALPFALFRIRLPAFLEKVIDYMSSITVPLALLDIGMGLVGRKLAAKPKQVLSSVLWKIVATPLIFVFAGILAGLNSRDLGILFLIGSAPTAVSSYAMTKGMGGDADLASDIILGTTLGSGFTMGLGLFLLRHFGLL